MSGFRFSLQRVLDWRQTQLQMEEVKLRKQAGELDEIDRLRADLAATVTKAEAQMRNGGAIPGSDLAALGNYRLHVRAKEAALLARRSESEKKLAERQSAMLAARRRCRLLERLKEKRQAEWEVARTRELEELASDSFVAQWTRRQA